MGSLGIDWDQHSGICSKLFCSLGLSESTGNCLRDIQNQNLGSWAPCIMIPVFIVVTISHYTAYRQLIWLHSVRKKIEHKK
jgi:hypothetical protein